MTWSLETTAGSWLTMNTTSGELTGTPGDGDEGSYDVKIKVSDGNGGSDSQSFKLEVKPKDYEPPGENNNPVLKTTNILKAEVGKLYSVTYEATDDRTNLTDLVWDMKTDAGWLTFNKTSQLLSGTPGDADVGTNWVLISVSDGEGGSASTNFTITVTKPGVGPQPGENTPPSIDTVPEGQSAKVGEAFELQITGTDPDEGDELSFDLEGEPAGMVISKGGKIIWVPKTGQEGEHTVTVVASDGVNETKLSFTVTVAKADEPTTEDKDKEEEEATGLKSPAVSIPLGLIIGLIIGLLVGMMMRRKAKEEPKAESREPETDEEEDLEGEDIEEEEAGLEEEAEEAEEELEEEELDDEEAEWEE
jgi:hypothetical protein